MQVFSRERLFLPGRRPSVLPAQGNALGTGKAKTEFRPNGPTVRRRRGWAVGPSRQGRLVRFPRALPWAGRTPPLRGGDGSDDGTEPECRHYEYPFKFAQPSTVLIEAPVRLHEARGTQRARAEKRARPLAAVSLTTGRWGRPNTVCASDAPERACSVCSPRPE